MKKDGSHPEPDKGGASQSEGLIGPSLWAILEDDTMLVVRQIVDSTGAKQLLNRRSQWVIIEGWHIEGNVATFIVDGKTRKYNVKDYGMREA